MATQLFSNNAVATINGAISNVAITIVLATGKGALFSSPTGGDYELVTLYNGETIESSTVIEIVKITGRSTDTLTVVRAQEGTTGVAWANLSNITTTITKGTLNRFAQNDAAGSSAIAIGPSAASAGNQSVAVGRLASTSSATSVAVGDSATASATNGVAVGPTTTCSGSNAVVVGSGATGSGAQSITLGLSAVGSGADSISAGTSSAASSVDGIAVGHSASCTADNAIVLGKSATTGATGATGAVVIGNLATSNSLQAIAVGKSASATNTNTVSIGTSTSSTGASAIAIGNGPTATAADAIAIGTSASASGAPSIAIGLSANAAADGISLGRYAVTVSGGNLSIGNYAQKPETNTSITVWASTTAYTTASWVTIGGERCHCVVAGTSGGSTPTIATVQGQQFVDGSVVWEWVPAQTYPAIALGNSAFGDASLSCGLNSSAYFGMSVGNYAKSALSGIALGNNTLAGGAGSIAIRSYNFSTDNSLSVGALPIMHHPYNWNLQNEAAEYAGLVGLISSEPMDLTGGANWAATTAVKHGHVRKPTTPNNCMYIWGDNGYDIWNDNNLFLYSAATTDGTEPTWPTTTGGGVAETNGDWTCIKYSDGSYVMALPCDMVVEEVLFICYEATAISAQATISIGTTGNLTKIVNAQATVGLTADKTVTKWTPSQPVMVPDITIKIDTLATGTKMLGRFMFKGFYTKAWV